MIDTIAWLLLALAIALNSGSFAGFVIALVAMTVGVLASAGIRRLLSSGSLGRLSGRSHRGTAVVIGAAALAGSAVAEQYGLTAIFGAVLIGLAIPGSGESSPWTPAVRSVSRAGQWLLPVFFVTTGLTLLAEPVNRLPWMAIALVTVLGMLSKTAGTYFGARLAGESRSTSARLGALMNTRGLTEIVVLQAGYSAGILTAGLFLAFLVIALATTAATGPLLSFVDRRAARQPALPPPSRSDVL
jgi:Kef-type K+ transport system membrane component KefB